MPVFGVKEWKNQSSVWEPFPRNSVIIKIAILGYVMILLKRFTVVAQRPSFYPGYQNWGYFRSTGSGFRDTGRFSKIAVFKHETWNLKNVPDVAYGPSFCARGLKLSLFLALRAAFQNCLFEHETWNLKKSARSYIWTLFYLRGSQLSSFSLYGQSFSR